MKHRKKNYPRNRICLYSANYSDRNIAEFGWGRDLMKSKGLSGRVSRYGFKNLNKAKRFGKGLGRKGMNKLSSITNSDRFKNISKGIGDRFNRFKNRFSGQSRNQNPNNNRQRSLPPGR